MLRHPEPRPVLLSKHGLSPPNREELRGKPNETYLVLFIDCSN